MNTNNTRYLEARRITLISAMVNAILGLGKVILGISGKSHALLADGIHSIADLATDLLVIVAARFGSQKADREHPYGHQRIETAATMFLALLLILTGAGIAYDATSNLFLNHIVTPKFYVLFMAFASVLANEAIFHYTKHAADRIQSQLLLANAWHHRSDAASSLVVLIGVGGALAGLVHLDAIAAIIVGFLIIKMGGQLAWSSIKELIDTGVDNQTLEKINQIITSVSGVIAIHQLRTRSMGGKIFVDVHVLVSPDLSVSEGHHVGQRVHFTLQQQLPKISDVTVHIDPEDDQQAAPSLTLPSREELLPQLMQCWQGLAGADAIDKITIHYLQGQLHLQVYLPSNQHDDFTSLQQAYTQAIKQIPKVASVEIFVAYES